MCNLVVMMNLIIAFRIYCLTDTDPLKIHPLSHLTRIGECIDIACDSAYVPKWTLFDNSTFPRNVQVHKNKLTIKYARLFNKGPYECEGYNENDELFYAEATLIIKRKFIKSATC